MKILVSIVTTDKDYIKKIEELKKFKIKEIGLFLTLYADKKTRTKIYKKLLDLKIKIPFVHLRDDMKLEEVEYLIKAFDTRIFNSHPIGFREIKDESILKKYKKLVYLENTHTFNFENIDDFDGICLDVTHLENERLKKTNLYKKAINILENYKCGAWHISAIRKKIYLDTYHNQKRYDVHDFRNLNEFDYLKKYKKYKAKYLALEIENSIEDQLKAKEYIEKLLA